MILPRRARTASVVVVTLLGAVLASDVAGLPGCQGGCKTATATAAAELPPARPTPPLLGVSPFDGAEDISPLDKPSVDVVDGLAPSVRLGVPVPVCDADSVDVVDSVLSATEDVGVANAAGEPDVAVDMLGETDCLEVVDADAPADKDAVRDADAEAEVEGVEVNDAEAPAGSVN